jgi:hypothetical protein
MLFYIKDKNNMNDTIGKSPLKSIFIKNISFTLEGIGLSVDWEIVISTTFGGGKIPQ